MSTVVCNNLKCPYIGGGFDDGVRFCRSNMVSMFNGHCGVYFNPLGEPYKFEGQVFSGVVEQDSEKYVHRPVKEEENDGKDTVS